MAFVCARNCAGLPPREPWSRGAAAFELRRTRIAHSAHQQKKPCIRSSELACPNHEAAVLTRAHPSIQFHPSSSPPAHRLEILQHRRTPALLPARPRPPAAGRQQRPAPPNNLQRQPAAWRSSQHGTRASRGLRTWSAATWRCVCRPDSHVRPRRCRLTSLLARVLPATIQHRAAAAAAALCSAGILGLRQGLLPGSHPGLAARRGEQACCAWSA